MTADVDLLPDDVATLTADAIAYFNGLGTKPASRMAQAIAARDAEIEALRAEVDRLTGYVQGWEQNYRDEKARAEQLEEALREARQMIRDLLPDATFTKWDALLREQENDDA